MSLGLVGRKVGMTRIFTDDGVSVPVTVLDVSNNRVAQIKTPQNDGYTPSSRWLSENVAPLVSTSHWPVTLPKAGVEAGHVLKEFPVSDDELAALQAGDHISVRHLFALDKRLM
jgi:large subunit ribosomal protein L3